MRLEFDISEDYTNAHEQDINHEIVCEGCMVDLIDVTYDDATTGVKARLNDRLARMASDQILDPDKSVVSITIFSGTEHAARYCAVCSTGLLSRMRDAIIKVSPA